MFRNCLCAAVVAITANGFFLRYLSGGGPQRDNNYQPFYHVEGESLFFTPEGAKSFSDASKCASPTFSPILQSSVYWRSGHGYSVDRSMSVVKNPKDFLPISAAVVMREAEKCKLIGQLEKDQFSEPVRVGNALAAAAFGMGRTAPTSPRFWRRHFGQGKRMHVECANHKPPLLTDPESSAVDPSDGAQGGSSGPTTQGADAREQSPADSIGGVDNAAYVPDDSDTPDSTVTKIYFGIATEGAVATKWEKDGCPKKTRGSLFESLVAKSFYVPVYEPTKNPGQKDSADSAQEKDEENLKPAEASTDTFSLMEVPVKDAKKPTLCSLKSPTTLEKCDAWKKGDNYQKGDLVFLKRPVWWKGERTQVHLQKGSRKPVGTVFLVVRPDKGSAAGVGGEIHVKFGDAGPKAIFAKKRGGFTSNKVEVAPVHLVQYEGN